MYTNGLIKKIRLISKSMMSQPSYETIAIHILLKNISSKSNQGIRFGELIEYSRKNVGDKLFPDTFLRNQN